MTTISSSSSSRPGSRLEREPIKLDTVQSKGGKSAGKPGKTDSPSFLDAIGNFSGSDNIVKLIDRFTGDRLSPIQSAEREKLISAIKSKAFRGLGENWWMQIIDGADHKTGPLVFDLDEEPGYLAGIKKGFDFVSSHLEEPLSAKLYKEIHQASVCPSTVEKMAAGERGAGKFMPAHGSKAFPSFLFFEDLKTHEEIEKEIAHFELAKEIYSARLFMTPNLIHLARALIPNSTDDEIRYEIYKAKVWLVERQDDLNARVTIMNEYIAAKSRHLGLDKPLCKFFFYETDDNDNILKSQEEFPEKLYLSSGYYKASEETVENIVKKFFEDYERNMKNAKSPEEKLRRIAELYQNLNWLHPFCDGQGRTTLLLLGKELCRHGFNPAILNSPYICNYCLLDNWVSYLREGMIEWQKEYVLS